MDSNIVLSYYEERTRDWRTRYVADIMHIKYAEHYCPVKAGKSVFEIVET